MNTAPHTAQEAEPTHQQEHLAPELVLGMLAQLVSFAQQMQPATRLGRLRGWLATLLDPRRARPPAPDAAARAQIIALLAQLNAIAIEFPPNAPAEPTPSQPPAASKPSAAPATPRRTPRARQTRPAPAPAQAPALAASPLAKATPTRHKSPAPARATRRPQQRHTSDFRQKPLSGSTQTHVHNVSISK